MEISSKNDNFRYEYYHVIKLGTASEKKKNIAVFLIFLCTKFWEKNFQKIRYQLEISSIIDNSRYKYFHRKELGTAFEKKKNITVFFIFSCKKFWEKNFQKMKQQLEISSKNNNSRYKYFHMIKLGTTSEKKKNIAVFFIFSCKKFWEKNF